MQALLYPNSPATTRWWFASTLVGLSNEAFFGAAPTPPPIPRRFMAVV
jgi:hypothetical protein